MRSRFPQNRAVIGKTLGAVVGMLVLRLVLTAGDSSVLCTEVSTLLRLLTVVFDLFTIVGIPLIVALAGEPVAKRPRILALVIALVGFVVYQLIRNPCLVVG